MKILNLLEMEKALLEEHVRYGEARFRDKELVRPFVNRIYQDLAEIEEAMKHKTCDGCKHRSHLDESLTNKTTNGFCVENGFFTRHGFCCNKHEPKATT